MGCFHSKQVHAVSNAATANRLDCESSSSIESREDEGATPSRGRVGIAPRFSNTSNPYPLVGTLASGEVFSDDSSDELEASRANPPPAISITSSSDEETASPHNQEAQLTSPGSTSVRDNQSLEDCGEESVVDWLGESGTTLFSTTLDSDIQSSSTPSLVATRDPTNTGGPPLNGLLPLPQRPADLQDTVVKDTTKVERRHAPLPSNTPSATKGNWITNRYVVNQYIVLSEIGRGAHSEVRLAKHKTTNELFACKLMSRSLLESSFVDVKREVSIMRGLQHKNILRLYEVLDDPSVNKVYLIMELANGGDLHNFLQKDSQMSFLGDALRDIARQVMQGLLYLHQNNHTHNDLKPSNILIASDGTGGVGTVKIADFGVSGTGRVRVDDSAGTPAFMAPEVVAGEPHDGQLADCYALGATLFYLSFGRTPFVGKGAQKNAKLLDLYDQIKHAPLHFPGPLNSGLKDLITRLMRKDPMQRLRLVDALRHPWLLDTNPN